MAKEFWLSLPVRNLSKSKDFFTAIGFKIGGGPGNTPTSAPLLIGDKNVVVVLFEKSVFEDFVNLPIANTQQCSEVLLSIDAQGKDEVDEIALKAVAAGGTTIHKPYVLQGNMYSCVFSDLDGHKWNVLYMEN